MLRLTLLSSQLRSSQWLGTQLRMGSHLFIPHTHRLVSRPSGFPLNLNQFLLCHFQIQLLFQDAQLSPTQTFPDLVPTCEP